MRASHRPTIPERTGWRPIHYERHRRENTTLYRPVQQQAAGFIAHTEASTGAELPRFIMYEFDAFLECGVLAHGLLRSRSGGMTRGCSLIHRVAWSANSQVSPCTPASD